MYTQRHDLLSIRSNPELEIRNGLYINLQDPSVLDVSAQFVVARYLEPSTSRIDEERDCGFNPIPLGAFICSSIPRLYFRPNGFGQVEKAWRISTFPITEICRYKGSVSQDGVVTLRPEQELLLIPFKIK